MSDEQPKRRWRVEVIPRRTACIVTVEAESEEAAIGKAMHLLENGGALHGAVWDAREVER